MRMLPVLPQLKQADGVKNFLGHAKKATDKK